MKFCMIGCGEHAVSSHGPSQAKYAARAPGFVRAACCDVDRTRAETYAARFGFARVYQSVDLMLDEERPDSAALVVPTHLTCALGTRVLERGIPLLLEKPPGETVAEVDRLAAAASTGPGDGVPVPHQVAFNRRYVPLVSALRRRLDEVERTQRIHYIRYTMVRVNRRDQDFSTTAIHAIDAVRFITHSDFADARCRYDELPALGRGVANIFIDGVMTSGAVASLAFCPVAGVVVERAEIHAHDHTFFLEIPMWNAYDAPGRLVHLASGRVVEDVGGSSMGEGAEPFELGGFYDEYVAFFEALAAGRSPSPGLLATRQSVAVAEAVRARATGFRP